MRTLGAGRRDQHGFTLVELLVTLAILGLVMGAALTVYMTGNTIGSTGQNKAEAQQAARAAMLIEEELRMAGYGYPLVPGQARFTAASPTAVTFWADVSNASTTLSANLAAKGATVQVLSASGIKAGDNVYLINGGQWEGPLQVGSVQFIPDRLVLKPPGPNNSYPAGSQVGRPLRITYSWNAATQTLSKDAGDGTGLQPLATGIQNFQFRYFDTREAEIAPANLAANLGNIRRIEITVTAQSAAAQNRGSFTMTSSVRPRNL
jgi:prepilin-type N-terminal cleavage/methylation domain-containing protein